MLLRPSLSKFRLLTHKHAHNPIRDRAFRSATKVLRDQYPLSAVLLYRKLIEYVMDGAKSKYYGYAAKDVISCEALDKKISDYQDFKTHESYFLEFQEKHKRKPAFWARYKEETAKQMKKQPHKLET